MLKLEVVLHLVAGVPLHAEVVRADRHAAVIEVAVLRAEDLIHHGLAVRFGERLERVPAELVEAAAEALHGLRVAAGRLERILILRPGADGPPSASSFPSVLLTCKMFAIAVNLPFSFFQFSSMILKPHGSSCSASPCETDAPLSSSVPSAWR